MLHYQWQEKTSLQKLELFCQLMISTLWVGHTFWHIKNFWTSSFIDAVIKNQIYGTKDHFTNTKITSENWKTDVLTLFFWVQSGSYNV